MLILTCPAQLQRLEGALRRSLPLALPVHGAVMNINRGNPGEFEVAVDSWPHFGAVLARRSGEMPVDDCYRNTHAAFYRDVGAYRALLETPGCLRWDTAFHIFGGGGHRVAGHRGGQGHRAGGLRVLHLPAPRPQHPARAPAGPRRAGGLAEPGARGSAERDVGVRGQRAQPAVPGGGAGAIPQPLPAGRGRAAPLLGPHRPLRDGGPRLHPPCPPPVWPHAGGAGHRRSPGAGPWLSRLWAHGHGQPAHAAAAGGVGPPAAARALPLCPAQPRPGQGWTLTPSVTRPGAGKSPRCGARKKTETKLKRSVDSLMAAIGLCLPPAPVFLQLAWRQPLQP
ncbi:uncharacterized protein LJ206_011727 isoform 3-T3 [Theristicus caerulescens]